MNDIAASWVHRHCQPCEGGVPPLTDIQIRERLAALPGWQHAGGELVREFVFKGYGQTLAFANAVAYIAVREDHHPTLEIAYKTCRVRYRTHSIQGLSENDFICAAKVDALLA